MTTRDDSVQAAAERYAEGCDSTAHASEHFLAGAAWQREHNDTELRELRAMKARAETLLDKKRVASFLAISQAARFILEPKAERGEDG